MVQSGFQTAVNTVPAVGVEGDFASANIYTTYDAGPGGCVAGASGANVGAFCWAVAPDDADGTPITINNFGTGNVAGFIHREQQALITAFLGYYSLQVPQGYNVTVVNGGDFWVRNNGTTTAVPGQKAYANYATGLASFAATGTPTSGGVATGSTVTPETASWTGSITGNVMTVASGLTGNVYPGETISGTNVSSGTVVQQQLLPLLAGEALNGLGRYYVSIGEQTVAAGTAISATYGLLTVGTVTSGNFAVNDVISGTNVVTGTQITQLLTGTGGSGTTAVVNNNTNVGSTTITAYGNVETKWYAASTALVGELVKMTSHQGAYG